jgi:hypothetical protein
MYIQKQNTILKNYEMDYVVVDNRTMVGIPVVEVPLY